MSMSRAVRQQLVGCDLVYAVVDSCLHVFNQHKEDQLPVWVDAPTGMMEVTTELLADMELAVDFLSIGKDTNGHWLLTPKETKQYVETLYHVNKALVSGEGDTIKAATMIRAAQVWAEDVLVSLPKTATYRLEVWRRMADNLQRLYLIYDPDEVADEYIDEGQARGEHLKVAAGIW